MLNANTQPLTAYPRTESSLRRKLSAARIQTASLQRLLRRCSLESCRGMCCYDGIYLDAEEARVIAKLARREEAFFRSLGLTLPDQVIVDGAWENRVFGKKTAVAARPWSTTLADFPAHFNDTACVFLAADGRCGLQALSKARGRHPWYYKPTGCWLHPLTTDYGEQPVLGVHDEASDPCRLPHYDGFTARTYCGRTAAAGQPAFEVLRARLDFLGQIVGRDFYTEIAQSAGPPRHSLDLI